MRPRSANEWRSFWHQGGEAALASLLRETWPPLHDVPDEICTAQAERVALLLGSSAPLGALAAELGRIRAEVGADPDPDVDRAVAERVHGWFQARSR